VKNIIYITQSQAVKRGIGSAIERGLSPIQAFISSAPEKERSVLSNKNRLSILVSLINHPMSPISNIAENMGISESSVRWHIAVMVESSLIEKIGRRYAVKGFALEEYRDMFVILNSKLAKDIVSLIVHRGPLTGKELERAMEAKASTLNYHLKKIEKSGIIRKKDGVYELNVNLRDYEKVYGPMVEWVLARIATEARYEGVSMEIERKSEGFLLRVSSPIATEFQVYELPFYDVLF